jgi:hypothetical protein
MVGQSHGSFTLLSVKDVLLFQHALSAGHSSAVHGVQTRCTLKQTLVSSNMSFVTMSE